MMRSILSALEQHARQTPDRLALRGDEVDVTWAGLQAEVARLAGLLQDATTVGLLLANGPAWVIADLAVLRSGNTCVPIPPFFSPEQTRHAISDAGISRVLTDDPAAAAEFLTIRGQHSLRVAGQPVTLLQLEGPASAHHGIAKITYTSGTTGQPKGVPLSRAMLETVASALCAAAEARADDRALSLLPLATLLENIASVYVPILAGAQLLVPSPARLGLHGSSRLDAAQLGATLRALAPSTVILPPQLLKVFIGLAAAQALPASFRFIAVGGAPVARAQLAQAAALGLPVYQGYGFSEAASVVALNRPGANRPGSVGRPLGHCAIRIAADGEILVRGCGFQGYLHQAPAAEPDWYATGDLGVLDADGYLTVSGRKREVIISSYGRNIAPAWVEAELVCERDIAQAAVFGNDRPYLSAVLVPAPQADAQAVQAAVSRANARLPDYARVLGVVIAGQPFSPARGELTANGRPRRAIIERHYRHGLQHACEDAS